MPKLHEIKAALRKARWVMRQVQGTMALEGQALPRDTYREMVKRTARELLGRPTTPEKEHEHS